MVTDHQWIATATQQQKLSSSSLHPVSSLFRSDEVGAYYH